MRHSVRGIVNSVRRNPAGHMGEALSVMRGLYQYYQKLHWASGGATSYGDHLLFQRLYEDLAKQIDEVAEQLVGEGGASALSLVGEVTIEGFSVAAALEREAELDQHLLQAYKQAQAAGRPDLEAFLSGIASQRRVATYLLNRRAHGAAITNPSALTNGFRYKFPHKYDKRHDLAYFESVAGRLGYGGGPYGITVLEIREETNPGLVRIIDHLTRGFEAKDLTLTFREEISPDTILGIALDEYQDRKNKGLLPVRMLEDLEVFYLAEEMKVPGYSRMGIEKLRKAVGGRLLSAKKEAYRTDPLLRKAQAWRRAAAKVKKEWLASGKKVGGKQFTAEVKAMAEAALSAGAAKATVNKKKARSPKQDRKGRKVKAASNPFRR